MVAQPLLRRARASLQLRMMDARDALAGRRDQRVPPRRLSFVGDTDFVATGDEFLSHFVTLAGLAPTARVLDIGCGIGRMARPLAGFLRAPGSYDGFDVNPAGIAWCQPRYPADPPFRFQVANLRNAVYNPDGAARACEYRFPYGDASFDFAFATSVFTHLIEEETSHYLDEAVRVLAPGGRLLATFLVLDDASRPLVAADRAALRMVERNGASAVADPDVPEQAIAFDRAWILETMENAGLSEIRIVPGTWSGRADGVSYQDIVVASA